MNPKVRDLAEATATEAKSKQRKAVWLTIIVGLLVTGALGVAGYTWWTTTPYHALRQIRIAIKTHDPKTFNRFVDVAQLVTTFTQETIFSPAETTPNLTGFQKAIGLGAFRMAKVPIDNALIFQIQKWIARKPDAETNSKDDLEETAISDGDQKMVTADSPPITAVLKEELKNEKARLKQAVYQKMVAYARTQPDTLVHRIFVAPEGKNRNTVRKIFRDYGFQARNIKKVKIEMVGEKCLCTLDFYCPISESVAPVTFELTRDNTSPLSVFRITRLIKAKQTFASAGENIDEQVHGLVTYGLADVSLGKVFQQTKSLYKRIQEKTCGPDAEGLSDQNAD